MAYLDHAATTPVLPVVVDAMTAALRESGNASSLHTSGRAARRRVEEARESIAADLGALPSEVVFTSGGTESDNIALTGVYRARRRTTGADRVVTAAIEHHAVTDTAERLAQDEGARLHWLAVDGVGRVRPAALEEALAIGGPVAVASVMWANNEIGTVNPIRELAEVAHTQGVPLHSDAVQALGMLPVGFADSGLDAMTVTGHKIGGPVGVGILLARRDLCVQPITFGGGQERGIRSGTLDVPGVVGLAVAVSHAVSAQAERARRVAALRDRLVAGVLSDVTDVELTGDTGVGRVDGGPSRLPGNAHFRFARCEADSLLLLLDAAGIECSTGSACTAGVARPSHVLLGMGIDEEAARGALRFSLGDSSTDADVDALLTVLPGVVARARRAFDASRSRSLVGPRGVLR